MLNGAFNINLSPSPALTVLNEVTGTLDDFGQNLTDDFGNVVTDDLGN